MSGNRITDFTQGSILRHMILFSVPMFLGNLLQAFYNTVDSIWVGRILGPDALGAVSVGFPVIFALIAVVMGITMAATVLVSQFYGAKQIEMVKRTVGNTLAILVISGVILSAVGVIFAPQLLRAINTPARLMGMAVGYLRVFSAGLIFMFLYNGLGAILRGLGDSRTPLLFLLYATIINVILDPLMIFGVWPFPRLGVVGAALATVIAQAISALLLLRHLSRVNHILPDSVSQWRLDPGLTKTTFKIGLPAGIQQLLVSMGGLVLTAIVNSFGPTVVAAFGAAARLDQFAFMPAMSVGLAVSSLTGQNLGAGKDHRVKEVLRWGALLSGGITFLVALAAITIPHLLLIPFTDDKAVLTAGASYLRIVGFSYVPFALMFAVNGVLRGAGDTVPTMLTTLTALWLVRLPLANYLSHLPGLGVRGVWLGVAISPFVGLLLSYVYYLTGRWKKKSLVHGRPGLDEV